ncbi:MAG: ribosomal protein S18-alanine N-acetyltransferase [Cyanobacteria bacterium J06626_18]
MTSLHCRPLAIADLPAVLKLDQACFGGLWSHEGYQRELDSPNSDLLILETLGTGALEQSPTLIGVGCLWAILDEAHITLLGIAPSQRRRGLGQWLLLKLLHCACDRGLTHATLEVRQSNQKAQALYNKLGFQIAGERRKYYVDGENALILWRNGLQDAVFRQALQTWTDEWQHKLSQQGWQTAASLFLPQLN